MVDHLAVANWMFATVNRDEDTEPAPYPDPVPRPGDGSRPSHSATEAAETVAGTHSASAAEIVAFLSSPA